MPLLTNHLHLRLVASLRVRFAAILVGVFVISINGCSRGPVPINVPEVDPVEASQKAIELYDTDQDSSLSDKELAACPGILIHQKLYDADANGSVSQQEIEAQVRELLSSRVGLTSLSVQVRMNGRPLKGARVKLVPEAYLGDEVKIARGISNARGIATMYIDENDLSESEHGLDGVHYGTYKVEVTHPEVSIPEKYNTQTTLGYETEKGNPSLTVELKNR